MPGADPPFVYNVLGLGSAIAALVVTSAIVTEMANAGQDRANLRESTEPGPVIVGSSASARVISMHAVLGFGF